MLRIYRAVLRLYPGEFRDEYGRELSLVLADRLRDESSAAGRVLVWLHALAGVIVEAPFEHLRVALGASASGVRRMVMRHAMTLAASGLAIGIVAAAALAYLLRTQLYQVSPLDPVSYAIAPAIFLLTGALAAYLPGRAPRGSIRWWRCGTNNQRLSAAVVRARSSRAFATISFTSRISVGTWYGTPSLIVHSMPPPCTDFARGSFGRTSPV